MARTPDEAFGVGGGYPRWGPASGPDGVFTIQGVPPGDYLLSAGREGYLSRSSGTRSLTKVSAEPCLVVEWVLMEAAELRARALGSDGAPLAGAIVSSRWGGARADDDGWFTLRRVPAGRELELEVRGGLSRGIVRARAEGRDVILRIPDGVLVTIPFTSDRALPADAEVTVSSAEGGGAQQLPLAPGDEQVRVTLRPGTYAVVVMTRGEPFRVLSDPVVITVPEAAEHRVAPVALVGLDRVGADPTPPPATPRPGPSPADPASVTRLRVLPPAGATIAWGQASAAPRLWFAQQGVWARGRSRVVHDGDPLLKAIGLAQLDPEALPDDEREDVALLRAMVDALDTVALESLTIEVWDVPDGAPAWLLVDGYAPLELGPLVPGERDLRLAEGGLVEVRLLDAAGRPRVGERLVLHHGPGLEPLRTAVRTDAEGVARWPHATPGTAAVWWERDGEPARVGQVVIEDGRRTQADLRR